MPISVALIANSENRILSETHQPGAENFLVSLSKRKLNPNHQLIFYRSIPFSDGS